MLLQAEEGRRGSRGSSPRSRGRRWRASPRARAPPRALPGLAHRQRPRKNGAAIIMRSGKQRYGIRAVAGRPSLMMIALAEKATAEKTTSATPRRRGPRIGVGEACTRRFYGLAFAALNCSPGPGRSRNRWPRLQGSGERQTTGPVPFNAGCAVTAHAVRFAGSAPQAADW